jgi:hypothetical protein
MGEFHFMREPKLAAVESLGAQPALLCYLPCRFLPQPSPVPVHFQGESVMKMMTSCLLSFLLVAALGCATTKVSGTTEDVGRLAKPERIVVHRFATSADDVRLDHSVTAEASWKLQGVSEASERQDVARAVSAALADNLVKKIQELGLPAELAEGEPTLDGRPTLVIDGQIFSIDEGSRTARVAIGLGAGRSDVRTAVQVHEILLGARRTVDQFEVDAKSGSTPGMAETMGAGAAAGHLATSAAVSVAKSAASEKFGDDVDADARRTATEISKVLASFFARQGWISLPEEEKP